MILLAAVTLASEAHAAPVTLKNDTYAGGSISGGLQKGFVAGESFAAIFTPPFYPFTVTKVQALIADSSAGSVNTKEFGLLIYQDTAGSKKPGTVKYDQPIYITGSSTELNQTDVTSKNVVITKGNIRVQYRQLHKGAPSIVRDNGPRKAKKNMIHGNLGTGSAWHWVDDLAAQGMNIKGNWIIRVIGDKPGSPVTDSGVVSDSGASNTDSGGAAGMGGEKQACYPNGTCNAGLTCYSNICVVAPDQDEGCSVAGGSRGAGPGLLLLTLLLISSVRRRQS